MKINIIFLSTIGILCIVLFGIGFIFNLNSPNVEAGDIGVIYNDNIKLYDSIAKEVTITDLDEREIVKIKLLTPLDNQVARGYGKVAEYEVNSIESLKLLISKMELYDEANSMSVVNRQIDYKIKGIEQIRVDDYETICKNITDEKTLNITQECIQKLIGSHLEDRETWTNLDKVDFLKGEKIIVGLFTDVQKDDKIEWIPTFQVDGTEIRVEEWASWTESMNTNLLSYYKLDEASGNAIDSVGTENGTLVGSVTQSASGKIGTAYGFDANAERVKIRDNFNPSTYTNGFTINGWIYITDSSTQYNAFYYGTFGGYADLELRIKDEDTVQMAFPTGNSGTTSGSFAYNFNTGTWYMLTLTQDANYRKVYVNGAEEFSEASVAWVNVAADLTLSREYSSFFMDGRIDETGLWSRALTSDEINDTLWDNGNGNTWTDDFAPQTCTFSGFVKDEGGTALVGANVTIWNMLNVSENYQNYTNAQGSWKLAVDNSGENYMSGAYYNNSLIGQLKPYINSTCV